MAPLVGLGFDLADLALTLLEIPFGKSDAKDVALASFGVFATAAPGPVDVVAGGAKKSRRLAKVGAKVADAGTSYLDDAAAAGQGLIAHARVPRVRNAIWGGIVEHGQTAMDHIRNGHFHDSRPGRASSRFSESNSQPGKIKSLVQEAVAKGTHTINSRGQSSIRHQFKDVIGTDVKGRKTKQFRVV